MFNALTSGIGDFSQNHDQYCAHRTTHFPTILKIGGRAMSLTRNTEKGR